MRKYNIKIAIVGVGNCASSLVQGIEYYRTLFIECGKPANLTIGDRQYHNVDINDKTGLMHPDIGGYRVTDIVPVVAFDVDERKVGKDISEAVLALPNCTKFIHAVPYLDAPVYMGPILDGVSEHMLRHPNKSQTFMPAKNASSVDVAKKLREHGAEIVVNYLPVGSEQATKFYAQAALKAGCAFVNCIPSFIASNPEWAQKFKEAGLPALGDDIKSQLGATYLHRMLVQAAIDRGLKVLGTSQYNQGGNTDFLNMTKDARLRHKLESKHDSIMSLLPEGQRFHQDLYCGPGEQGISKDGAIKKTGHGWHPDQKDEKTAQITLDALMWGGIPGKYLIDLVVEDSPDSAGVAADAIRCAKLALDRGVAGAIEEASSFFFKHPPKQVPDAEAKERLERFIRGR